MKKKLTNREKSTILTIFASLLPNIIVMFLGAIKTKYIISYLGSNANGIYQVMVHLSSLVIFGNLGLSAMFKIEYYKSLANNDNKKTTKIYNYSKIFFKKITFVMLVISIFISLLAIFFVKTNMPIYQKVLLQFLICSPNILSFYIGKEITLLSARQKEYLYIALYNIVYIFRLVLSLLIIKKTNDLFIFLSIDMIITSISYLFIEKVIKKDNKEVLIDTEEIDRSPITFSKYIIPSKVSNTIFLNIDAIVISSMISNVMVSIFTAYIYIANCVVNLERYIINSLMNSLGNLYHSKDDYKQLVTNEVVLLSTFIFLSVCVPLTVGMEGFVSKIWINDSSYVLDKMTYIFICIYYLLYSVRLLSNLFEDSIGSYKETCAINIIQAVLNVVLSIMLCKLFGVKGIIFATIIILGLFEIRKINKSLSLANVKSCNKYLYVFLVISIAEVLLSMRILTIISITGILEWFLYMLVIFAISLVINVLLYSILYKEFRILLVNFKRKLIK